MSPRHCLHPALENQHDEDGRIGILLVACGLIVLLVVLVSAAVTSVHMQRRQLFACADAVAVGSAGLLQAGGYFTTADLLMDPTAVEAKARDMFNTLIDSTCQVGEGSQLTSVEVTTIAATSSENSGVADTQVGARLEIHVEATAKLPLLPSGLRLTSQPLLLRVSSTADLK